MNTFISICRRVMTQAAIALILFPAFTVLLLTVTQISNAQTVSGINSSAWYEVINQTSNKCLDSNMGTANGTALQQFTCGNQQTNQQWQFRPAATSGFFAVFNRFAGSLVWDDTGGSKSNSNRIQLFTFASGNTNQEWQPVSLGNGLWRFVNLTSGLCLDDTGGSTSNGTQMQQFQCVSGNTNQEFKLTQVSTPLSVSPTAVTVGAAANSTGTFNVISNTNWTVAVNQPWLTVSPASGSNNGTVRVTAQQNTSTSARSATVTVSATGVASQTVTVTQNGSAGATLSVSPTAVTVDAAANSTGTFNVMSNTIWTAAANQPWLTVSPASGSNNGTVTVTAQQNTSTSARSATVTVSATDVASQTVTVTQNGSGGTACNTPPTPSFASLPTNVFLPDPFTFFDGTQVTTKADWTCRRAEVASLAQQFEYGDNPDTPSTATTGSLSGNTLTVTVTANGQTISFNAAITYPSSGTAPFPALIAVGGSSLNNAAISSQGVAIITLPNDQIAQQNNTSSRGIGLFYNMFGANHSAGAMMAWAWGASRLIDALEKTPAASIDTSRLGVTGCSRNGKGALVVGAFDERIKLTIPQESGSGGSGSWRVSDFMLSQGQQTQTLSEIVNENVWFRADFGQFSSAATKLPFDHHLLIGLVAPRPILIIDNNILWLGPQSSWTDANAAHMIWQALGVPDQMGYSLTNTHNHCAFPSSQQPDVDAYVQKFLVGGGTANTNILRDDPGITFDQAKWVNWITPVLQ